MLVNATLLVAAVYWRQLSLAFAVCVCRSVIIVKEDVKNQDYSDQLDASWVVNLLIKMANRSFVHRLVLMAEGWNDSKSVWKNRKKKWKSGTHRMVLPAGHIHWQASKARQLPCPASHLVTPQDFPLLLLKTAELCEAAATARVKMPQSRGKTSTTARCHFQCFLHIVFSLLAKKTRCTDASRFICVKMSRPWVVAEPRPPLGCCCWHRGQVKSFYQLIIWLPLQLHVAGNKLCKCECVCVCVRAR